MKSFLQGIGLLSFDVEPYNYNHRDYKPIKGAKKAEAHKNFLKGLVDEENHRLTIIENKTSQLVAQTGIIFSLLTLFIPIIIDKVTDVSIYVKSGLLLILVLAFLFYLLTILNAIKNFNVAKFNYSKPSPKNVLDFQDKKILDFYVEEVQDLLYSINNNLKVNNRKATNLLHSYNAFKIANILTGILVILIGGVILFFQPKENSITIDNAVKIENLDSVINNLAKEVSEKSDTVYIKSDK